MIKLKVRSMKNIREQKVYYYPAVVHTGTITRNQLCKLISEKTTVTRADVLCAIVALEEYIAEKLANSGRVKLGDLGTFSTSIRSTEGVDEKEQVSANHIKTVRVRFRPSAEMKQDLQDEAQFQMV